MPALLVFGLVPPILLLYLWFRYRIIECFSRTPILYFRSFRYADGPTAFARIISKTARRYGVPMAIVHKSQPGSALQRWTRITDQAITAVLPDLGWQAWVDEHLKTASAVIIDTTVISEGLAWEVAAARVRVPHDRILVLLGKGTQHVVAAEIATLAYNLDDAQSVRRARRELRAWFERVRGENKSIGPRTATVCGGPLYSPVVRDNSLFFRRRSGVGSGCCASLRGAHGERLGITHLGRPSIAERYCGAHSPPHPSS